MLQNVFKLQKFRPLQLETVNVTMARKDIFLVMPTGGGKSLCYQLPALCSDGVYTRVAELGVTRNNVSLDHFCFICLLINYLVKWVTLEKTYLRVERNGEVIVGHMDFTMLTGMQVGWSGGKRGVR